jgi:hypothetical protein
LLAWCPDGCTEAVMQAHGFTIEQIVELIRAGLVYRTFGFNSAGRERYCQLVRLAAASPLFLIIHDKSSRSHFSV